MLEVLEIESTKRNDLIDITAEVSAAVSRARIESGVCYLYIPHATAGVTINENADPTVRFDIIKKLDSLVPRDENYTHPEGNSDSHVKSSIMGTTLTIIIKDGSLVLGTWQGIYFCEFDGPRSRKIYVKTIEG
ncbi:MAG: secondary thiamine-phosphate synthase enzyme YjbQ [Actinomycetia bacterium]|nr:secondary thiamine-phosphate synthase enzyme YjbQ [Actinomycetes bacterium]